MMPSDFGRPSLLRFLWVYLRAVLGSRRGRMHRVLRQYKPNEFIWHVRNAPTFDALDRAMCWCSDVRGGMCCEEHTGLLVRALEARVQELFMQGHIPPEHLGPPCGSDTTTPHVHLRKEKRPEPNVKDLN